MKSIRQDHKKEDLIILDFDGTLFYNALNDFSVNIPLDNILGADSFFSEFMYQTDKIVLKNTEVILITGRHESQKLLILTFLEHKGYNFDQTYFNQMSYNFAIDEKSFFITYWTEKVKLINQLRLSNEYKSIVVIDDDEVICSTLQKLNFEVYRVEITRDLLTQTLSISFSSPHKRLMTELQNILKPTQKQKERITETV